MSLNKFKDTILTVEVFLENRPDMEVHTEPTIKSCIYQAASLLNSETNGLLEQVWNFNYIDPGHNPHSPLARSEFELNQMQEAMIVQTQYMLNLGNDLTQGGGSYSIGNINASWSRPNTREIIAPGVHKLLNNARVYELQDFGIRKVDNNNCKQSCYVDRYTQEPITRAIGDKRYVEVEQGEQARGNIAIVNNNGMVEFANPNEVQFNNYNADKIKDWHTNDYLTIDKITNMLLRGQDLYGVHSGVERGEIYHLLSQAQMNWNPEYPYKKDQIWDFAFNNNGKWTVISFLALRDNINKPPLTSNEDWVQLGVVNANIDEIAKIVYDRVKIDIDNQFNTIQSDIENEFETIKQDIDKKLTPIDYVSDYGNEIFTFESEQDYNNFLTNANIDNSYFQDIEKPQRIIFYEGEVKLFATQAQAIAAMEKYNLVQDNDYIIIEADYYLKTGIEAGTGGSNLIKQSDLPNINLAHSHIYHFGGGSGGTPGPKDGYNGNANAFRPATDTTNLYLNGNVEQTEFKPKYINVAMVQILKDIRG